MGRWKSRVVAGIAAAVIAMGVGTLGVGSAYAAPSSGATGQDRACERHDANNGKAVAKGLECGPTFTVVLTPDGRGRCIVTVTGNRLLAGATVLYDYTAAGGGTTYTDNPLPQIPGGGYVTVSADGTLNGTSLFNNGGHAVVFHVATANGGTATFAVTNSC